MIERYTLPEMGAVWSEQAKFQSWLDVEIAATESNCRLGRVPQEALDTIKAKACLLYTSPSPRDLSTSRMPSSA